MSGERSYKDNKTNENILFPHRLPDSSPSKLQAVPR